MLLCVHIPAFRLCVARGPSRGEAAVLADKPDRGRVIECDAAAYDAGARPGQTVLQARAASGGGVRVFHHDPDRSRATWHDVLDALDAVSPLVDDSGEGTAYLEMRGIDGDAHVWVARARKALAAFDLPVRVAAGPNKFLALAYTYARNGEVSALPIEMLGLDPRIVDRLHLLGVRCLGDLARLPHGPFVRRFGKNAAAWHDRARGIDPTPLRPRAHELQIDAAVFGEGSAEQEEQVFFALRVLAERVCGDLARAGKAASLLCMTFECENGDVHAIEAGLAQATGDPRTMLDVMRAKLEGRTFGAPVTGLRLQAMRLEECGAVTALFGQNDADPQALGVALARLQAVAPTPARRARLRPAHRLEHRYAYEDFRVVPSNVEGLRAPTAPTPQLRLLAVREVDVTLRGNQPQRVDARKVLNCAGPWRIDEGWFDERDAVIRDEYDVLLDDGMLCRIYRQGERWYLRGAYD